MKKTELKFYRKNARITAENKDKVNVILYSIIFLFIIFASYVKSPNATLIGFGIGCFVVLLVKTKIPNLLLCFIIGLTLSVSTYFIEKIRFLLVLFIFISTFPFIAFLKCAKFSDIFKPKYSRDLADEFFVFNTTYIELHANKIPGSKFNYNRFHLIQIINIRFFRIYKNNFEIYTDSEIYYSFGLKTKEIEEIKIFILGNFSHLLENEESKKANKNIQIKIAIKFLAPILIGNIVFFGLISQKANIAILSHPLVVLITTGLFVYLTYLIVKKFLK